MIFKSFVFISNVDVTTILYNYIIYILYTDSAPHWLNCSMPMMERLMFAQLEKLSPSQCATQPPEPTNVDLGSSS